eukprot:CAMPEP_0117444752 /NCGR_PEP_ID=MMETSP0759-20121206/5418_1 /TAXON_ID=63605 /ORGANISM="Percolomonas cosmopolitus, Strain WS" /LENGTH=548 /DNA_ID=CAMNT_0005236859 /DNA_START=148 /DNA_END=1790 /DNA_ORIENTATION=-
MSSRDSFSAETSQFAPYSPHNRLIHCYAWGNKSFSVKTGLIEYEPLESLVLFENSKRLLITPDRITQYSQNNQLIDEIAAHIPIVPPFEIRLFDNRDKNSKLRVNYIWRVISTKSLKDLTSDEFAQIGRALLAQSRTKRVSELGFYAFENNDRLNSHLLNGILPLFSPLQTQVPNDHVKSVVFVNRDNVNYHLGKALLLYMEPRHVHSTWTHPDVDPTQHLAASANSVRATSTATAKSQNPADLMEDSFTSHTPTATEEDPSYDFTSPTTTQVPILPFVVQQNRIHVSVASFNVLAQSNTEYLRHCAPHTLQWAHRKSSIVAVIRQMLSDNDIICLQGVEKHMFLSIFPALKHQYNYFYSQSANPQFCASSLAVFYNKFKFSLLEKKESLIKNSNDIFQTVVLESTHLQKNGRNFQLMVTNVALASPNYTNQELLFKGKDVVQTVEKLLDSNLHTVPCLLCGLPLRYKSLREFLSNGVLDSGIVYEDQRDDSFYNEITMRHRLQLQCAYPEERTDSSVWYSSNHLSVNGLLEISCNEPIPNQRFGSDS